MSKRASSTGGNVMTARELYDKVLELYSSGLIRYPSSFRRTRSKA
jgi:hypothetical protein